MSSYMWEVGLNFLLPSQFSAPATWELGSSTSQSHTRHQAPQLVLWFSWTPASPVLWAWYGKDLGAGAATQSWDWVPF